MIDMFIPCSSTLTVLLVEITGLALARNPAIWSTLSLKDQSSARKMNLTDCLAILKRPFAAQLVELEFLLGNAKLGKNGIKNISHALPHLKKLSLGTSTYHFNKVKIGELGDIVAHMPQLEAFSCALWNARDFAPAQMALQLPNLHTLHIHSFLFFVSDYFCQLISGSAALRILTITGVGSKIDVYPNETHLSNAGFSALLGMASLEVLRVEVLNEAVDTTPLEAFANTLSSATGGPTGAADPGADPGAVAGTSPPTSKLRELCVGPCTFINAVLGKVTDTTDDHHFIVEPGSAVSRIIATGNINMRTFQRWGVNRRNPAWIEGHAVMVDAQEDFESEE